MSFVIRVNDFGLGNCTHPFNRLLAFFYFYMARMK